MQTWSFELGVVHAHRYRRNDRLNEWIGPWAWDTWLFEHTAGLEHFNQVEVHGQWSAPFRRPPCSWCLYAPRVRYRHLTDKPHALEDHRWFFFSAKKLWPSLNRPYSMILDPGDRLAPHLDSMHELQQGGAPGADTIAHAHALVCLTEALAASRGPGLGTPQEPWVLVSGRGAQPKSLLQELDETVLKDLARAPSIDQLAEQLNLSVSSLAHRFRKENDMTVMQRVRWLRVREARRLLSLSGALVKSVARDLGYCSPFHFSQHFRDITGMTAQDYLRRHGRT